MTTIRTVSGADVYVSDGDYQLMIKYPRYMNPRGYAFTIDNGKNIRMHRLILGAKTGEIVDHADRNRRNNCRENLRIASVSNNRQNSSKKAYKGGKATASNCKGVTRSKSKKNPWQAMIWIDKKPRYLGLFKTQRAAARAYDREAKRLFGRFACTNKMLGLI